MRTANLNDLTQKCRDETGMSMISSDCRRKHKEILLLKEQIEKYEYQLAELICNTLSIDFADTMIESHKLNIFLGSIDQEIIDKLGSLDLICEISTTPTTLKISINLW